MNHPSVLTRMGNPENISDPSGHLSNFDRFLRRARIIGFLSSVPLLALECGGVTPGVRAYAVVVLFYLIMREVLNDARSLPGPTPAQLAWILTEFALTTLFVYLSGQADAHINLIMALPAVGYAARYGQSVPVPVTVGTLASTAFLGWLRIASHDYRGLVFLGVEAGAVLTMTFFAARASHRSHLLTTTLSRSARRSRLLLEVSQYANQSLAVSETFENSADAIRRLTGCRPAFFLYDMSKEELQMMVSSVVPKEEVARMRFSPSGTMFEEVMANRQPLSITDVQNLATVPEMLRGRVAQKVGMVFPLEHAGTFLGTMNIGRRDGPQFNAEEIEIFSGIAGLLSQAVHNARRHEEAERLSVLDELTGLYNHRYFQAQLARRLAGSVSARAPFTLVMLDLDDFKAYNDLFGHQQGDEVLKQVGSVLAGFFPIDNPDGFAARYGGEEFVLVIPGGSEEARSVCEEVRLAIGRTRFPGHTVLERGRITVSLGAAVYPIQADSRDTLIAAADTALYRAKHLGKDRCEFYTSVLDAIETDVIDNSEVAMIKTIKPLVSVINGKDNYTYGHSERVVEHALALGRVLGLSAGELSLIAYAAFLHDLGKLEISRELLNKTEPLTDSEWQTLRKHPVWGAEMVGSIPSLAETVPAIRHHHERWDGSGYPDGLAGERIPLFARIIAVVDAFDAMITARPYRREKSVVTALAEIAAHAGSQFDPVIAQAFCSYQKSLSNVETETA